MARFQSFFSSIKKRYRYMIARFYINADQTKSRHSGKQNPEKSMNWTLTFAGVTGNFFPRSLVHA
jgi:hypothetical protein